MHENSDCIYINRHVQTAIFYFSNLGPVIQNNTGTKCNINWHTQRDCESITECSECIAVYPQFKGAERVSCCMILLSFKKCLINTVSSQ